MTTHNIESTASGWNALPSVVRTYLTAHRARDVAAAISTFTTEFTAATTRDAAHFDVLQRLVGDFPGGVADLHYRFTLADNLISRLVIEP